jgi:predicted metal-binding membrane protein
MLVGAGYFFVWTLFGLAAFAIGVALASSEMQQPALARVVPLASGFVVLVAGTIQFTRWKANRLTCCREAQVHGFALAPGVGTALWHGLGLGLDCALCCAGLMVVLLVIGVMDLRTMAGVTAAVSAERLVPGGQRVARAVGSLVVGEGLLLITRAVGLV